MNNILINNILVTGGLGFIGSHFAKLLANSGHCPTIIDKNTYAADINRFKTIKNGAYKNDTHIENRLHIGDICNDKLVTKIVKDNNIETIVNFAAETHVDRSIIDSKQFIHSNIVGVQTLLEISRRHDLKLVQISTDEVYGSIKEGSFKETDKLNPGNPYSACKSGADLLCTSYYNTYGLDTRMTRSSNNYGPFQHSEKFIPRMINLATKGKPLEVYGNGKNIRDWLYVEDNCKAIKVVMERGKKGEIYNVGAGNELTNNQVAKIIAKRFDVPVTYINDRPGHDFRYSIDYNKIIDELGWKPETKFEDGLEHTINSYTNRELYK